MKFSGAMVRLILDEGPFFEMVFSSLVSDFARLDQTVARDLSVFLIRSRSRGLLTRRFWACPQCRVN